MVRIAVDPEPIPETLTVSKDGTATIQDSLKKPIHLPGMFFGGGRKLENQCGLGIKFSSAFSNRKSHEPWAKLQSVGTLGGKQIFQGKSAYCFPKCQNNVMVVVMYYFLHTT